MASAARRSNTGKAARKSGGRAARAKKTSSASRSTRTAPTAPAPRPRRAVFVDVENTSSENDLLRVLDELAIDRAVTELTAVGNWRVVGHQLARTLAERGAQLVHSAPAPRVKDWSDLWIAVCAGMWLGRATPGDQIDIVSDDRAFDAVGDAAARLGVHFRRITYRTHAAAERAEEPESEARPGGRRRRRRRRSGTSARTAGPAAHVHAPAPSPRAAEHEEPHSASQEQIRSAIARLTAADPVRGVGLDMLAAALKAEGFQRPPGSPRLVTRLRRLKDVEVSHSGRVRLVGEAGAAAHETGGAGVVSAASLAEAAGDGAEGGEPAEGAAGRKRSKRRGRRGGRRRSGRLRASSPASAGGG